MRVLFRDSPVLPTEVVDMLENYPVTIGSETAVIKQVSRSSGIVSGGLDATMRRYHFSLDYEIYLG
jgi:hypothetical protein